jgi:hypothetical protein
MSATSMSAKPMEICPMCAMCPRLSGRWRLQVRCRCGACGPRMKTPAEAIGRWNSVVGFVRQLSLKGIAPAEALRRRAEKPAGMRRLVRQLAWQCGLEPHQGC